ncbi:methyltransferase domain-containing protein [Pleionea sp. CnH1-48]|uniref:methyltransferase domain-containing protein n=1 Tax=Pleionea sp. CnH1-48 TaxID=2954494 RepID=UPI002096C548|nr:methyltransferase domain-containing protein [Pleionea sp. CnH1-48]MCO7225423.1 class I SAM-dependent methyltransferase [Pleionea sp. CnH1-48]
MALLATAKTVSNGPENWESLPGGRKAFLCMQYHLEQQLPQSFGYYGLTLGPLSKQLDVSSSPIRHWFHLEDKPNDNDILCDYHRLPIASDSVDFMVISHLLEYVSHPHRVLREAERVIIPEGKIILSGVNPFSFYGMRYLGCRVARQKCLEKQLIGMARIKDWLMLLGFALDDCSGLSSYWQRCQPGLFSGVNRLLASRFTSHYFIIARKKVSTLTPIRPSWTRNSKLVPARFAEPGVRQLVDQELKKVQN